MAKSSHERSASAYFLEAHYYSAGLRCEPLSPGPRPDWAPAGERVGFRDEFPLIEGEAAVEVYRLRYRDQKLTWIGLFYRAPDQKFGDRQNHAGVGVWLNGQQVVDASKLIVGLQQFATEIARGKPVDGLFKEASTFCTAQYLGKYVLPAENFPDQFQGWEFQTPEDAMTQVYLAQAAKDHVWSLVCDLIVQISYLPAAEHPGLSRAIILATTNDVSGRVFDRQMPVAIAELATAAIIRKIPQILPDTQAQNSAYAARVRELSKSELALSGELEKARAEARQFADENSDLKKTISENETLKTLVRIQKDLGDLKERSDSLGNNVRPILAKLDRIEISFGKLGPALPTAIKHGYDAPSIGVVGERLGKKTILDRDLLNVLAIAAGGIAFLILFVILVRWGAQNFL